MNLLFVCKYNRFRSKVAEAFFKKINKNKTIKVKSAGLIKGGRIGKNIISAAKENGISIIGQPRGLSSELLMWQDMIVIAADDVPQGIFENKKYGKPLIAWKIPDAKSTGKEEKEKIIKKIKKKVCALAKKLNGAK